MTNTDDDLAYDGSNAPQLRELTARERDILCRLISNELWRIRTLGVKDEDPENLGEIHHVIDPRRDE